MNIPIDLAPVRLVWTGYYCIEYGVNSIYLVKEMILEYY